MQDTEGNEWEFHFRYWSNCGSKMYVLEGLKDYMIAMKWQAGDIGKFCEFLFVLYFEYLLQCKSLVVGFVFIM